MYSTQISQGSSSTLRSSMASPAEAIRSKAVEELNDFLRPFLATADLGDTFLLTWILREWENRRQLPGESKESLANAMAAALGTVPDYVTMSDFAWKGVH